MQLHHFFEYSCDKHPNNIALVCDNAFISYQELELRANQLAHYLAAEGIQKGRIVGILLDRSVECYIAILAILKTGASYVPLDPDYPDERINYIFSDLPFDLVITSEQQHQERTLLWPSYLVLDELGSCLELQSGARLTEELVQTDEDDLCYVIYTSGSTGKPKGVEITHKNITHYVHAASKVYEMTDKDKVYQGFSLAFDASLEEIWMAFAHGAALIACTSKEVRSGLGLLSFLQQHQVTVFSTVPTLLSTLEGELPHVRLLILGGEVCPPSLVKKWQRPDLTIMNTYGPTEASVVTTYFKCQPGHDVTLGQPLPGYDVLIMDEHLREVADGETGELFIGGGALARGYVNKPEMTAKQFIMNPAHSTQRLYRTGDLVLKTAKGELHFVGRADDQIKLRGFRIELNEIEHVIMTYAGVKQAIVSLKTLEQPTLVAYLILESSSFDLADFKVFLRERLPDYMMPALFEILDAFPLLSSGKVNRKALPAPTQVVDNKNYIAPETPLEKEMASVWSSVLGIADISVEADFFYDLGGHSLFAAQLISQLRKLPALSTISILDLYKNPTVKLLAYKFKDYSAKSSSKNQSKIREKYKAPQWKYVLCGIGQFFGCIFQFAVGSWQLLATILCYEWITSHYSVTSVESQVTFLGLFLSMPLLSLIITVGMKWLLLGRVKPGVYPLWGWFYYRWWLVQRLHQNVYLGGHMTGSPLMNFYYRLLGAKIGKNCHIATTNLCTPDLISIGDHVSIGIDSQLRGYIVEDGWLKIGTIEIQDNCYIGSRAVVGLNSCMERNSVLEDMSMIVDETLLEHHSYYSGSPAVASPLPKDHVTRNKRDSEPVSLLEHTAYGVMHYLGLVFAMVVYYLCYFPSVSLISYVYDHYDYLTTMSVIPVAAILFLLFYYVALIACKKIIVGTIKPGSYPVRSIYYLRYWIIDRMFAVDEISIMADSLYLPIYLRFLGAKLGKSVELGEAPHIIPDLVSIDDGGFVASRVALAWPAVHQGIITFAPVSIGKKGFSGNISLIPGGKRIGDDGLLGALSIPPANNDAAVPGSVWLGSPAVFLPKRELFPGYSNEQTYNPTKQLYLIRLAIEFIRIIIPTSLSFVALFSLVYLLNNMIESYSWPVIALLIPLAQFMITLGSVMLLVGLKWLLLGKQKPIIKPLWDIYIWKTDIIEYSYSYFIKSQFTNKILGAPLILWLFRLLGTSVGERVFVDSDSFAEFGVISIGDDTCINANAVLQTHLYEDRIFKVSHVTINKSCNIGVGSVILYNTLMEENSSLGSLSLLMKGECLPTNTQWAGIPAQTSQIAPNALKAFEPALSGAILVDPISEVP